MWAIIITYACVSIDCSDTVVDQLRFETFSICEDVRRRTYIPNAVKTECRQVLVDEDE